MTDLKDIEPVAHVSDRDNCRVWWNDKFTHISQAPANDSPLYSATQVELLLEEREARIAELEEVLELAEVEMRYAGFTEFQSDNVGKQYVYKEVEKALSTTSPKSALEAYGKSKYAEGYEAALSKGRTGVGISN